MSDHDSDIVRLKLISQGFDGLYELLDSLSDLALNEQFVLRRPYAVGGQSILWLTDNLYQPDQAALTRMALLPYHRPAYIEDVQINRVRRRIEREARLLHQFNGIFLPKMHSLFYAHNPLQPPERGPYITDNEPYLVIELIKGATIASEARRLHNAGLYENIGTLALKVAYTVVKLCQLLEANHLIYTDLNPNNLIWSTGSPNACVRVVDAGSIIPDSPTLDVEISCTWAYIPPKYYNSFTSGGNLWPDKSFVIYTLGKTLWQILSNRRLIPGKDPDINYISAFGYPNGLVELIDDLISQKLVNFNDIASAVSEVGLIINGLTE